MSRNAFVRRQGHRSSALLSVAALAATGLIAAAAPAGAAVTSGGGTDPEGRPGYFRDSTGIALQLCTAAEPNCEPVDPADPLHGAYFSADAQAGPVLAIFGIETAGGEDEAGNPTNQAILSNGALFRARGLTPGARYTIKHPWGTNVCTTDGDGDLNNKNCGFEAGGEEGGPLGAGPVKTFLRSLAAGDGFIGNHELSGPVTGSPTGFNRVTVTGPGLRNATTTDFSLMGQMRDNTAMSSVNRTSLKLGSVKRSGASVGSIRVSSFGTADLSAAVTKSGANPAAFQVADNCASVAPGSACTIAVTYTPRANRNVAAVLTIDDPADLTPARRVALRGIAHDTLAPKVASRTPAKGARNVRPAKSVKVQFSEAVRGVKGSFTLVDNSTGKKVRANVSRVRRSNSFVLNPSGALKRGTGYSVKLDGGRTAIRDLAGNAVRDMQWKFSTR